ncbi:HNH endonuclease [Aquipseudomonas alcaligenes]|uniref:HNH endonuclease n=1 Tax=Aquipseudomonas alcaligenes TaxID=43263 RepID=UPI00374960DB
MAKNTPSMAKNMIKRSLLAVIDPYPSKAEIDLLWKYFQSSCAYCGVEISRESRTGHMDHVVSSALGGSNSIYNHVLSCSRCNGDEKREESWQSFLTRKATNQSLLTERHNRISQWFAQLPAPKPETQNIQPQVDAIINNVLNNFDAAVKELRALRAGGT